MSARVSITLPLPPSANEYWKPAPRRGLVPSSAALRYKANVANLFRAAHGRTLFGDVTFSAVIHFPSRRGDLGNRLKVLEDALNGHAWLDDSQIQQYLAVVRHPDPSPHNPRVERTLIGERFATLHEIVSHRMRAAEAKQKRRATIARNRALKHALALQSATRAGR